MQKQTILNPPQNSKKNILEERKDHSENIPANAQCHLYGNNSHLCVTDSRGYPTPRNMNPAELVLDTTEGFIPLWKKNVNLRWRFSPSIERDYFYPDELKEAIRILMANAILAWGDAAPISFSERSDAWDFEIVIKPDNCNRNGCTLASAFFPDGGRHELAVHHKMFTLSKNEQIETMVHELGHVFGLRHFFANVTERAWPSVIFGEHRPFSIMNYGDSSVLTNEDKSDLKMLYQKVWSGELTSINGTRIVTFLPYHYFGNYPAECQHLTT